jgi:hypothetical protein
MKNSKNKRVSPPLHNKFTTIKFTQESVVGVWLEEFLWTVQIESEWKENFHVWFLRQQSWIGGGSLSCIFKLIHANCILSWLIALSIQWIEDLKIVNGGFLIFTWKCF